MSTLYLIDASPYLFRAFFSLPRTIVDPRGRPVNAVYGFTSFLARLIADDKPSHVAVAFDRHFNQSFRNDYYPPYKAQREKSPEELDAQVDPAFEVVEAMGIAAFIDETHEADDLIGTIIEQTFASDVSYVIVTSDKDLTQLVGERVTLIDPARNLRFDAAAVEEKFGVRPDQIVDFLALAGDAVDNIPGVRGIGPKGAAQLLQRYGSLDGIYANLAAMKATGKRADVTLASKLESDAELARLSQRLAIVSRAAPIEVTLDALRYRGPDDARVAAVFTRLGFDGLQQRVRYH